MSDVAPSGWPVSKRALIFGGAFLLLMWSPFGAIVGFMIGFGCAMFGGPILFALGEERAAPILIGMAVGLPLTGLIGIGAALFAARSKAERKGALNVLVIYLCVVAGLVLSVHTLQEAWP